MLDSIQLPALVIFDLGGTTIRDRGEVPAAFAGALEASGLTVDPGAIAAWRGASKREVVSRLVAGQRPARGATEREALVAIIYGHFCTMLTERLRTTQDLAFLDEYMSLCVY